MKQKMFFFILGLLCCGFLIPFQAAALTGDANSDGAVDIIDALAIARYCVGLYNPLPDPAAADIDCSGVIDIVDALMIARFVVGMIDSLSGCTETYPTTLLPLPDTKIAELQAEFDALNNNTVSGTIGPYGLLDDCFPSSPGPPGTLLTDQALVVQMAKNAVLKNSKFTNVTATTPLDDYVVIHITGNANWIVRFNFRSYRGIPCEPSAVFVYINSDVYCLKYHCYPDNIFIPSVINITPEQAQRNVLGEVLVYSDVSGEPREFIVTEADLTILPSIRWIIPRETNERLEYRSCWEVPIAGGMWDIFVDVMTGEIIGIEQNFQT